MKKLILVFVSIIAVNCVFGQFTFGPMLGWNSSKISSDLGTNLESSKSAALNSKLMAGIFLRVGKGVYFQPEVFASSKGGIFNYKVSGSTVQIQQQATFKTIDVPLLIGKKLIKLPKINTRIFFGPVASFITDKTIKLKKGTDNKDLLTKDDFKDITWGGQIGIGADLFILSFDIKYELGLNDISNSAKLNNTKINMLCFTLGIKIL